MDVDIKVIATVFPTIAIVLGFFLISGGYASNSFDMVNSGWNFVFIGFIAQMAYLVFRYVLKRED